MIVRRRHGYLIRRYGYLIKTLSVPTVLIGLLTVSCADGAPSSSDERTVASEPTPSETADAGRDSDGSTHVDAGDQDGARSPLEDVVDSSASSAETTDLGSILDDAADLSERDEVSGQTQGNLCDCSDGQVCVAGVCRPDSQHARSSWVETVVTDGDGAVSLNVDIDGARSFLVTATPRNGAQLSVLELHDPSDAPLFRWQDWYFASQRLTKAVFAWQHTVVFNWPVRGSDPDLETGTYHLRIGSYESNGVTPRPNTTLDVHVTVVEDEDPEHGLVPVLIVYADALDEDPALVSATEAAVERWREVWGGAGVELSVRYAASDIDPVLPMQATAQDALLDEARLLADDDEVVVIIGDIVEDFEGTYGISGQIPGPLVATELTGVVIGWIACSGRDGEFSDDDVLIYGEVLAHEVGHYLGLFHPVDTSYTLWDALSDTVDCTSQAECDAALGLNVMFPYSICSGGTCLHATEISNDQRGVMQRYSGTL